MAANELVGTNLYLAFKGTAINTDYVDFAPSEEKELVDVSAGADTARTFKPTLDNGTAELTLLMLADGTAATDPWQLMDKGSEGTLEWGDEGTVAGQPRHYVNAIVSNRNKAFTFDGRIEMSFSFQFSGDVTDTVYA
jgi:hypothetical protein